MDPKKMSNDALASNIELWALMQDDLTIAQLSFFDEVIWRLKLMSDKEQEKTE